MSLALLNRKVAILNCFFTGTERFCEDIRDMIGFRPGLYWRICWRFAAPAFLLFITVYGLLDYEPLSYDSYVYPLWANALGWVIAGSSVICIPTVAIYKILTTKGTFLEVRSYGIFIYNLYITTFLFIF